MQRGHDWLFFMIGGALRAAGDARTPLRLGVVLTLLNVGLNVVFIRGLGPIPGFGTAGAAVGTVIAGGPAYIVKYASKGDQGRPLPRGARLYGVGGFDSAKRFAQWRALLAYVRDRTEQGELVRRAEGDGWLVRESGEHIPSEWERRVQYGPGYCRVTLTRGH